MIISVAHYFKHLRGIECDFDSEERMCEINCFAMCVYSSRLFNLLL